VRVEIIHEYTVTARVDAQSIVVTAAEAVDRLLPCLECNAAAPSVTRIVGLDVRDLRSVVHSPQRPVEVPWRCGPAGELRAEVDLGDHSHDELKRAPSQRESGLR
jgi:hypothetical protein